MKTHQPQMFQSIILMQVLNIFYQFSCLFLNPLDQFNRRKITVEIYFLN